MQTHEVAAPAGKGGSGRRRWLALAALAVAQFMVFLDETVVNVALPSIKSDLGFTQAAARWPGGGALTWAARSPSLPG